MPAAFPIVTGYEGARRRHSLPGGKPRPAASLADRRAAAMVRGVRLAVVVACSGVGIAGCWSVLDLVPEPDEPAPVGVDAAPPPAPIRDAAVDRSDAMNAGAPHRVFVTSTVHPGSSLAASPDTPCSAAAAAAGLPGRFGAWLSFTNQGAKDKLTEYGPWVTTSGQLVASDKSDLTKGSIRAAITYDEHGKPLPKGTSPELVWTGTDQNGRTTTFACTNWTGGDGTMTGTVGNATQSSAAWTNDTSVNASCLSNFHVYCFEQP